MAVRDLGYRPYEGERLPASHNTFVLLRHGLRRAWASWLVKAAIFLGWIPTAISFAVIGVQTWMRRAAPPDSLPTVDPADAVRLVLDWQLWLFVTMVSLGAGASAISEDLSQRAFQFYFAKPVTPPQYLAGRIVAVAALCFALTCVPAFFVTVALVGTALPGERLDAFAVLAPAVVHSAVIAIVTSSVSVAISSTSRSRALTMSAWALLFLVPHVLGSIVDRIAGFPWLHLASLPALLDVVGEGIFRRAPASELRWFHAAPLLAVAVVGGIALALRRLYRAEVIA